MGVNGDLHFPSVVLGDACFLVLPLCLNRQCRVFETSFCFNLSVCGIDNEDGFGLHTAKVFGLFCGDRDKDEDEDTKDGLRCFFSSS